MVIDAYLDILDYDNAALTVDHFSKVYESIAYKDTKIDSVLFTHLTEQSTKVLAAQDQNSLKQY